MKFRFAFSAFCMLVAMTMATDAIAQGVFRVTSGTESRGRATGHAEKAGDISLFHDRWGYNRRTRAES